MKQSLEYFALVGSASLAFAVHFIPLEKETVTRQTESSVETPPVKTTITTPPVPAVVVTPAKATPRPFPQTTPTAPVVNAAASSTPPQREEAPFRIIRVRQTIQRDPPLPEGTRRHLELIAQARAQRAAEEKKREPDCPPEPTRQTWDDELAAQQNHYAEQQRRAREEQNRASRELAEWQEQQRREARSREDEYRRREDEAARERAYILSKLAEEHPPVLIDNASKETAKNVREFLERNEKAAKELLRQSRR